MMNHDMNNLGDDQSPPPHHPELLALANDLDRLAAHEIASADGSLADRIYLKTRSAVLHEGMTPEVRRVHVGMAAVGHHERAVAPAGLEERVYDASVDQLARPAVLASIGARQWAGRWSGRVAVAAGMALAAVAGWVAVMPSGPGTSDAPVEIVTGPGTTNLATVPVLANAGVNEAINDTVVEAVVEAVVEVLGSSEAEDSFVALFAIGDDLGSDISAAASEAERVERSVGGEQASGG